MHYFMRSIQSDYHIYCQIELRKAEFFDTILLNLDISV